MIVDSVYPFILLLAVLFAGASHALRDFAVRLAPHYYLALLIYFVLLSLVFSVLNWPISFYSGYVVEHKFGLSNQTFWKWQGREIKKGMISFVIMAPMLLLMYFFLKNFSQTWWLFIALIWIIFTILLSRIAPQVIVPLFYKYKEIKDEDLKKRIFELAKRSETYIKDIFEIDFSRETKKANAALIGIGKTRRVILADTLLKEFSIDEIEAVIAHEMGHHRYHHMLKHLVIGAIMTIVGFLLAHIFCQKLMPIFHITELSDMAGFPLIALVILFFSLIIMPMQNMYSRKLEKQADQYSLQHCMNKESFITAMQKLSDLNLSQEQPNKIMEFLFYSHPSIKKRIDFARKTITNYERN